MWKILGIAGIVAVGLFALGFVGGGDGGLNKKKNEKKTD